MIRANHVGDWGTQFGMLIAFLEKQQNENHEEIALADDYFISRRLYPNVDFYTGLIYRAMGFPTDFFTVLFAMGRLPGWIAQYRELVENPASRIYRPRQIYAGEGYRPFVPRNER